MASEKDLSLKPLKTREDISHFFDYLIEVESSNFHPDDNFETYINLSTNRPTFSRQKAQALNARMSEAKKIAGDSVYQIAQSCVDRHYPKIKSTGGDINMKPRDMFVAGGKIGATKFFENISEIREAYDGTDEAFFALTGAEASKLKNAEIKDVLRHYKVSFRSHEDRDMLIDQLVSASEDAWRFSNKSKSKMNTGGNAVDKVMKDWGFFVNRLGGGFECYEKETKYGTLKISDEADLPKSFNAEVTIGLYNSFDEMLNYEITKLSEFLKETPDDVAQRLHPLLKKEHDPQNVFLGSYKKPIKASDVSFFLNSTKNDGHKYSLWNKGVGITFAYNGKLYANNGQKLPKGTVVGLDNVMNYWSKNNCDTLLVEDEGLVILPEKQDKYDCYTTGYDGMKNKYGNEDDLTLGEAVAFCWRFNDVRQKYATIDDLEKEIKSTPYGKANILASTGNITGVVVYKATQQYSNGGATSLCPVGTEIQTLIFSKDNFKKSDAVTWVHKHNFHGTEVDETGTSYRYRQQNPRKFREDSFRTITIKDGVKAVIGCPKNK